MKKFKTLVYLIVLTAVIASCSKKNDPAPAKSQRLVSEFATTNFDGTRELLKFDYDDQGKLLKITPGNVSDHYNPFSFAYNTGGILETHDNQDTHSKAEINLNGTSIETLRYSTNYQSDGIYLSSFKYDNKGHLINISTSKNLSPGQVWITTVTYTWDDNDNLIQYKYQFSRNPNGVIIVNYSGFAAENVNTVSGTNFGFNYFGNFSAPYGFTPSTGGETQGYLPPVYAGKLLPSTIILNNGTQISATYHKNAEGLIDRIEEKGPTSDYNTSYDIVYK